jgi:FPC/CPF motif-containing protein YcgG
MFSDSDPDQSKSMDSQYIHTKNWVFEFCKRTFFITTFSPCYPQTHSRYSFESSNSYVLFQPESSFARHNLEPFTIHTNWTQPKTIRDKIRVAYKQAGREYLIRDHPLSYEIIKPMVNESTNVIEWWRQTS